MKKNILCCYSAINFLRKFSLAKIRAILCEAEIAFKMQFMLLIDL